MLNRILSWRWFLPLTFVAVLFIATLCTRPSFFAAGGITLLMVICILLGRYRPDVLNAYLGGRVIERRPQQNPDVISALEQLTLAVEQCDDGHTPKPIHDAAARARDALDKLKPRS